MFYQFLPTFVGLVAVVKTVTIALVVNAMPYCLRGEIAKDPAEIAIKYVTVQRASSRGQSRNPSPSTLVFASPSVLVVSTSLEARIIDSQFLSPSSRHHVPTMVMILSDLASYSYVKSLLVA